VKRRVEMLAQGIDLVYLVFFKQVQELLAYYLHPETIPFSLSGLFAFSALSKLS